VGLYYVTFSVVEWLPVFIDQAACKIITDSLNFCTETKSLGVNAYVIMPTHLHANPCRKGLVLRPEDWRVSSALYWATRDDNDVRLAEVGWE
jgi:hypothetical protein